MSCKLSMWILDLKSKIQKMIWYGNGTEYSSSNPIAALHQIHFHFMSMNHNLWHNRNTESLNEILATLIVINWKQQMFISTIGLHLIRNFWDYVPFIFSWVDPSIIKFSLIEWTIVFRAIMYILLLFIFNEILFQIQNIFSK